MFRIKLLRPVLIEGRRWLRGAQLEADAAGAAEMIRNGTAALVDDADLPRLVAALPTKAARGQAAGTA